jgi:hypothetical protein
LEIGSYFLLRPCWTTSSYFMFPTIDGIQVCTIIPFYCLRCDFKNFLSVLALNCILPISVPQVARIIGMSYG